jgi:hypothetical protein
MPRTSRSRKSSAERAWFCVEAASAPLGREVRKVPAELVYAHLPRVALVVEEDEALDCLDVSLLGADAIMPEPQAVPHGVEERRFFGHEMFSG